MRSQALGDKLNRVALDNGTPISQCEIWGFLFLYFYICCASPVSAAAEGKRKKKTDGILNIGKKLDFLVQISKTWKGACQKWLT
jgi:hypothetical protein